MITKKELQYIDTWASKIPMPGIEYSMMVMEKIKECYEAYNKLYKGKEYNLVFSNGDEIDFEIQEKNLCHMLGIDYQNIKDGFFDKFRKEVLNISTQEFSSYDLLEAILENSDKVVYSDNNSAIRCKAINYYKSGIKCEIFNKLSNFDKFNFAAINYVGNDERFDYSKEKILFIPSNEKTCPYFFIIIKATDELNQDANETFEYLEKYTVRSLMAPTDSVIKDKFNNQEVVIPTQIIISDNSNLSKINATPTEKMDLLRMYKSIIETYNIPNKINIFSDYNALIKEQADNYAKKLHK